MSKILQFKRDTTANIANTTGAQGELLVDLTKKTIVVQDGVTPGGSPLATELLVTNALANVVSTGTPETVAFFNANTGHLDSASGLIWENLPNTTPTLVVDGDTVAQSSLVGNILTVENTITNVTSTGYGLTPITIEAPLLAAPISYVGQLPQANVSGVSTATLTINTVLDSTCVLTAFEYYLPSPNFALNPAGTIYFDYYGTTSPSIVSAIAGLTSGTTFTVSTAYGNFTCTTVGTLYYEAGYPCIDFNGFNPYSFNPMGQIGGYPYFGVTFTKTINQVYNFYTNSSTFIADFNATVKITQTFEDDFVLYSNVAGGLVTTSYTSIDTNPMNINQFYNTPRTLQDGNGNWYWYWTEFTSGGISPTLSNVVYNNLQPGSTISYTDLTGSTQTVTATGSAIFSTSDGMYFGVFTPIAAPTQGSNSQADLSHTISISAMSATVPPIIWGVSVLTNGNTQPTIYPFGSYYPDADNNSVIAEFQPSITQYMPVTQGTTYTITPYYYSTDASSFVVFPKSTLAVEYVTTKSFS